MNQVHVQKMTCARIPTDVGEFQLCFYRNNYDEKEHLALIMGDITNGQDVLVRIHSECFTGDVLGSQRCDCGQQLRQAMHVIAAEGTGVIVYLRQEGRGIGLLDKLRAYNLQDMGYDTVDANLMLGHQADARDYTIAALILQDLGARSLRLLTNNPLKIESLRQLGLPVTGRVPLQPEVNGENASYLRTKVERLHHLLNLESLETAAPANSRTVPAKSAATSPQVHRPFVTLSYAQSLDGSITTRRGHSMTISSSQSLNLTHRLRAGHDAILVGVGTVLADNPRLTVRLAEGQDPQPIIVDSQLRFPLNARLLQHRSRRPWIATTEAAADDRQRALEAAGACILRLPANCNDQVDLKALLARLAESGINSLMVEGGARVITSFLAARLVDRLVITVAPLLVGGLSAVGDLVQQNGHGFPHLRNPHYEWLGPDMVLSGDVIWDEDSEQ
jgi:3,4-dihydroxy 2-butanone 4-phosphate synthase/GTP cyclohydrolase II